MWRHGNVHNSAHELDVWNFHCLLQRLQHGNLLWHRNQYVHKLPCALKLWHILSMQHLWDLNGLLYLNGLRHFRNRKNSPSRPNGHIDDLVDVLNLSHCCTAQNPSGGTGLRITKVKTPPLELSIAMETSTGPVDGLNVAVSHQERPLCCPSG